MSGWHFDDEAEPEDDGEGLPPLGRLLSAMDAERELDIPATRIRKWAQRRVRTGLHSMGLGWRDHPLYWEADLVALSRGIKIRDGDGRRTIFAVPVIEAGS